MNSSSPTPAQSHWLSLEYGMFLHFGPNTLSGDAWGDGKFPADKIEFPELDCAQWARVAKEAGMRYAVLTTKHLDGFCLWPTEFTEYCVRNTPQKRDIVGEFVEAFRAEGIQPGFYHSMWDVNCPVYNDDARYAQHMRNQVQELLERYGPVIEWWFDGTWDKDHPTREWPYDPTWETDPNSGFTPGTRYQWAELYAHIHRLQPDSLVLHNSSSDRPGGIKYFPLDARTAEHYDFVHEGRLIEPPSGNVFPGPDGYPVFLPLEFCTSLNPGWFWSAKSYAHPSVATIVDWRTRAKAMGANLLLNVGPNDKGKIDEVNRSFLLRAADALG